MFPTPETSSGQQLPLDARAAPPDLPHDRVLVELRVERSRAMWAISGGRSAPPADTDSPPNIRWSTKRSSRSSSAPSRRSGRRWRSSGRGGLAAAGRSCRGGRAARRRCRAAARGTCRDAGPRRCGARRGPRRSRPDRAYPGGVTGRGEDVDTHDRGSPSTCRSRPRGRPRPRAAQALRRSLSAGGWRTGPPRRFRVPTPPAISPYAVSAAPCSASFLERPTPLP